MIAASAPLRIVNNNLRDDFSQVPIPTGNVATERITAPGRWSMRDVTRFILFISLCNSDFDYMTQFIIL